MHVWCGFTGHLIFICEVVGLVVLLCRVLREAADAVIHLFGTLRALPLYKCLEMCCLSVLSPERGRVWVGGVHRS